MNYELEEVTTELDAFDIYTIFKADKTATLLDSGMDYKSLGRYSIIGLNPFTTFKYEDNLCTIDAVSFKGDPFKELSKLLKKYHINNNTDLPYIAGAIGYFSYDMGKTIEDFSSTAIDDVHIPLCYFYFYNNAIIIDNLKNKTYISSLCLLSSEKSTISYIKDKILSGEKVSYNALSVSNTKFKSNFNKFTYIDALKKLRQYIKEGHVYIANLSQRISCSTNKEPYEVYKALRHINPAPFAAFMNVEAFSIVCSSPERFLSIRNNLVETRPIKGTRPRGSSVYEDLKNKAELMDSEKDKSELLMIVDLERNDLSKVCKPNSVKVTELFKLEEYSTVFHLVSTIVGELKEKYDAMSCIKACFPGGSITGAPKIRAMEIIDELEGVKRNLYTGCIGYLGFDGNIDLNIVIRTILMKENTAYLSVGGGITWESQYEAEYDETLDKAKALMRVL